MGYRFSPRRTARAGLFTLAFLIVASTAHATPWWCGWAIDWWWRLLPTPANRLEQRRNAAEGGDGAAVLELASYLANMSRGTAYLAPTLDLITSLPAERACIAADPLGSAKDDVRMGIAAELFRIAMQSENTAQRMNAGYVLSGFTSAETAFRGGNLAKLTDPRSFPKDPSEHERLIDVALHYARLVVKQTVRTPLRAERVDRAFDESHLKWVTRKYLGFPKPHEVYRALATLVTDPRLGRKASIGIGLLSHLTGIGPELERREVMLLPELEKDVPGEPDLLREYAFYAASLVRRRADHNRYRVPLEVLGDGEISIFFYSGSPIYPDHLGRNEMWRRYKSDFTFFYNEQTRVGAIVSRSALGHEILESLVVDGRTPLGGTRYGSTTRRENAESFLHADGEAIEDHNFLVKFLKPIGARGKALSVLFVAGPEPRIPSDIGIRVIASPDRRVYAIVTDSSGAHAALARVVPSGHAILGGTNYTDGAASRAGVEAYGAERGLELEARFFRVIFRSN